MLLYALLVFTTIDVLEHRYSNFIILLCIYSIKYCNRSFWVHIWSPHCSPLQCPDHSFLTQYHMTLSGCGRRIAGGCIIRWSWSWHACWLSALFAAAWCVVCLICDPMCERLCYRICACMPEPGTDGWNNILICLFSKALNTAMKCVWECMGGDQLRWK